MISEWGINITEIRISSKQISSLKCTTDKLTKLNNSNLLMSFEGKCTVCSWLSEILRNLVDASSLWTQHVYTVLNRRSNYDLRRLSEKYNASILDRSKTKLQVKYLRWIQEKINSPSQYRAISFLSNCGTYGSNIFYIRLLSPHLAPSYYFLFTNLKKWLARNKEHSNKDVVTETYPFCKIGPILKSEGIH